MKECDDELKGDLFIDRYPADAIVKNQCCHGPNFFVYIFVKKRIITTKLFLANELFFLKEMIS